MKKLFILSIILFIFTLSVSAQIYIVKDLDGNSILATDQENVIAKYKTDQYVITIINLSETKPKSPSFEPSSVPENESEIVILDWTNRLSESGNYYYVEGILKNISSETASDIKVKVQSFDKNNNLVSIHEGYADPLVLSSKQEATFSIMVNCNPNIDTFKIQVIWN